MTEDGVVASLGCFAFVLWALWASFWAFLLVMLAADFLDLGIAITDKI